MTNLAVTPIDVAYPDAADLQLEIALAAGRLKVVSGAVERWVRGTYRDPSESLPCRVKLEGGTARITSGWDPSALLGLLNGWPTLDLALGTGRPYALSVETGGSELDLAVGGVPLQRLILKQGAGKGAVDFASLNPSAMSLFQFSTGAGAMELRNLANANCSEMLLEGGAASCSCDFAGTLTRDTNVRISTGLSSVDVHVPSTLAARISAKSVVGGIYPDRGWTLTDNVYSSPAAVTGGSPVLRIHVSTAVGAVHLHLF